MLTSEQFKKSREFIYRYGKLLDRKRFAWHFEGGSNKDIENVLVCYQNPDGGFGHGLELDILCPESSGICTEAALGFLLDGDLQESRLLDNCEKWVIANLSDDGLLPHPVEELKRYPHGGWWENADTGRIFSVAALLFQLGRGNDRFFQKVTELFIQTGFPWPGGLDVYHYPYAMYLEYSPHKDQFTEKIEVLDMMFEAFLEKFSWHSPLYFTHGRWTNPRISVETWKKQAEEAIAAIQEDGGVRISNYDEFPWWRPEWTLEMLIQLKKQNLIEAL